MVDKKHRVVLYGNLRKEEMGNLDNWKYLQKNGYFKNHNCYKNFQLASEDPQLIEKIKDKIIVEIGCGYGRETHYFSKYARYIYAIDVSQDTLDLVQKTIIKHGIIKNVAFVLAEEYKNKINEPIDFLYSNYVFQHITPEIAKDYLTYFKKLLTSDGEVNILLRHGGKKKYPIKKEPLIEYTLPEINELFEGYEITDIIETKNTNYTHWRIKAHVPN